MNSFDTDLLDPFVVATANTLAEALAGQLRAETHSSNAVKIAAGSVDWMDTPLWSIRGDARLGAILRADTWERDSRPRPDLFLTINEQYTTWNADVEAALRVAFARVLAKAVYTDHPVSAAAVTAAIGTSASEWTVRPNELLPQPVQRLIEHDRDICSWHEALNYREWERVATIETRVVERRRALLEAIAHERSVAGGPAMVSDEDIAQSLIGWVPSLRATADAAAAHLEHHLVRARTELQALAAGRLSAERAPNITVAPAAPRRAAEAPPPATTEAPSKNRAATP